MPRKPLPLKRETTQKGAMPCVSFTPALLQSVKAHRPVQKDYLRAMSAQTVTFGLGASGTGKTYMAAGFAAQELAAGRIGRVVLSRPLIQCGDDTLGFLPGDLTAKVSPFMVPLLDAMGVFFCKQDIERLLALDRLRVTPLELMRGMSYKNTIIIVDECQNCTRTQLEMLLTRIDHGSKVILTGDSRQTDQFGESPVVRIVRMLTEPKPVESIGVVRFTREDNQRSPIVSAIAERLGI